jgi:hypothetical protein
MLVLASSVSCPPPISPAVAQILHQFMVQAYSTDWIWRRGIEGADGKRRHPKNGDNHPLWPFQIQLHTASTQKYLTNLLAPHGFPFLLLSLRFHLL